MDNTQGFARRFMERNPVPATPNPLVDQAVAQLRLLFYKLWILQTMGAMVQCAGALSACSKPKRGVEFIYQWESWQVALMNTIEEFFSLLFDIGRANVDCALPDPATWACDALYRLILEAFVSPDDRGHIVDAWIKAACCRRPIRIWESPIGVGFYGVSASDDKIRDADQTIPVLRQIFEQGILDHLFGCHGGALLRLANDGWQPAAEDERW